MPATESSEPALPSGEPNPGSVIIVPPQDVIVVRPPSTFADGAPNAGFVTIRCRWNFIHRINWVGLTPSSVVMASVAEVGLIGGAHVPFIGNAHVWIKAVAPANGFVMVRGYVDWDRDLDIRISLLWL